MTWASVGGGGWRRRLAEMEVGWGGDGEKKEDEEGGDGEETEQAMRDEAKYLRDEERRGRVQLQQKLCDWPGTWSGTSGLVKEPQVKESYQLIKHERKGQKKQLSSAVPWVQTTLYRPCGCTLSRDEMQLWLTKGSILRLELGTGLAHAVAGTGRSGHADGRALQATITRPRATRANSTHLPAFGSVRGLGQANGVNSGRLRGRGNQTGSFTAARFNGPSHMCWSADGSNCG